MRLRFSKEIRRVMILSLSLPLFIQPAFAQEALNPQPGISEAPLPAKTEHASSKVTEAPSLTLAEVMGEARDRNPEIAVARKKWEEEKAKIWAVKTWPDPQIGVEYWGKNETWYDVSQMVPFPGKLTLKGKAQAHEAKRQLELYQAKEKEILQKVKAAYYGYFLAWRQIEIFEDSVNYLKHFARVAESRYSVNRATQAEVLKAQVEYSKSLNLLVTLGQEKETMQAELNALLDQGPNEPLARPLEPPLPSAELDYASLEEVAMENRPEVHAARHHVDHMKADLWATRADWLPDTMVQYSRRTFDAGEMQDDNIVMVKFNVPVLWFWRQGSLVKAAKKAKEGAEAELRSMETMTRAEVKSFLVKVQTARRLVDLYRTTVIPQSETALKVSLTGYEAGTVGFLDLVDSERSWLEFQMEYYQYLAQYWTYLASLERLIGKDLFPSESMPQARKADMKQAEDRPSRKEDSDHKTTKEGAKKGIWNKMFGWMNRR